MKNTKTKQLIYLVGMPGSGKSTLGKALSSILNLPLIDTDNEIEQREGIPITSIFREKGEEYFRLLEKEVLRNITNTPAIIATGGGAPCFFDNMDFINANGLSIWLKVPPTVLAERVLLKEGSRPLLKDLKGEDLLKNLKQKYERREPFYKMAHLQYNQDTENISGLIDKIKSTLML